LISGASSVAVSLPGADGAAGASGVAEPVDGVSFPAGDVEPVSEVLVELFDDESGESAYATPGDANATPTPRVTANAPTRPMCLAYPIEFLPTSAHRAGAVVLNPDSRRQASLLSSPHRCLTLLAESVPQITPWTPSDGHECTRWTTGAHYRVVARRGLRHPHRTHGMFGAAGPDGDPNTLDESPGYPNQHGRNGTARAADTAARPTAAGARPRADRR
jgi:hypothetical protein